MVDPKEQKIVDDAFKPFPAYDKHKAWDLSKIELADRREKEITKAREKYGEIALSRAGHPDYDVLDYAINELVGLLRYAEMINNRVDDLLKESTLVEDYSILHDTYYLKLDLNLAGAIRSRELIVIRNRLLARGFNLGKEEKR